MPRQFRVSARLCLSVPSRYCSLKTLWRQWVGTIVEFIFFVSQPLGITILHCLMAHVLKIVVPYVLSILLFQGWGWIDLQSIKMSPAHDWGGGPIAVSAFAYAMAPRTLPPMTPRPPQPPWPPQWVHPRCLGLKSQAQPIAALSAVWPLSWAERGSGGAAGVRTAPGHLMVTIKVIKK